MIKELARQIDKLIPSTLNLEDIYFLCVGTDRSTGDAYGPLIGDMLKRRKIKNVIGTIKEPCHAKNLEEMHAKIPKGKYVVAIDACLGDSESVGVIKAKRGPLKPGSGVGKDLMGVGDVHIVGIVNTSGFMEYWVLSNTRLSLVMHMAEITTKAIKQVMANRTSIMLEVAVSKETTEQKNGGE